MNESDLTKNLPEEAARPTEVGGHIVSTVETAEPKIPPAMSTLKFLQPRDITSIEQALRKVGPDGEIRLTVENGRLFSIHALTSEPLDQGYPPDLTGGHHG
jgi:hypothetical protein